MAFEPNKENFMARLKAADFEVSDLLEDADALQEVLWYLDSRRAREIVDTLFDPKETSRAQAEQLIRNFAKLYPLSKSLIMNIMADVREGARDGNRRIYRDAAFLEGFDAMETTRRVILDTFREISKRVNRPTREVINYQQALDRLNGERDKLTGVSGDLGDLYRERDEFQAQVGNDTLIDSFKEIKSDLSKLIKRQDEELEDLRDKANQVEELNKTLTEKNNLIDELNDKLKRAEDEAGNLSRDLQDMDAKIAAAQDELRIERRNHDATKMALQSWRDAVADYAQVRDAMQNCSTFENLLKDRGLTDKTDMGLFAFVQELGKTIDFLSSVYQAAYDARKVQPTLMTKEECAVYMALNRCYRKIWNIDFDVFVTPGNRPISDDIEKIPFSRDDSIALKDPRNRSFRYVTGIYVPLLLSREGYKIKPAYVNAANY